MTPRKKKPLGQPHHSVGRCVYSISKSQYFQLAGLMALAARHNASLEDIEDAAYAITGGKRSDYSHTTDMVMGSRELDEGLELLKIKVRK